MGKDGDGRRGWARNGMGKARGKKEERKTEKSGGRGFK